jgi:8-oxo-dGTP diphosphatase
MYGCRIAASAIVLQEGKLLLVRYKQGNSSFFVGPGGGVQVNEDLKHALVREVKEETGLVVQSGRMLFVEDLLTQRYRMIKFWFLCIIVDGQLEQTKEAKEEGIIEVNWFGKDNLQNEIVYPSIIMNIDWEMLSSNTWQTQYLGLEIVNF